MRMEGSDQSQFLGDVAIQVAESGRKWQILFAGAGSYEWVYRLKGGTAA